MPEVTMEAAAEAVVEAVAPAVNAGTIDYKKVAIYAGSVIVVAGCGYLAYRAIKKRKAAKAAIVEVNPELPEEPKVEIEPAPEEE